MKSNQSLMRVALALGAIAGMSGGISVMEEHRPSPEYLRRRVERRQKEQEAAAVRSAARIAAAKAKRARKARKLAGRALLAEEKRDA